MAENTTGVQNPIDWESIIPTLLTDKRSKWAKAGDVVSRGLAAFGEGMTGRPFYTGTYGAKSSTGFDDLLELAKIAQLQTILGQGAKSSGGTLPTTGDASTTGLPTPTPQEVGLSSASSPSGQEAQDAFGQWSNLPPRLQMRPDPALSLGYKYSPYDIGIQDAYINAFQKGLEQDITLKGKRREELQKGQIAAEQNLTNTQRFMQQYGRSWSELKAAYPEIGDTGFIGKSTRKYARLETEALDKFPETKAFLAELKPLANQMARDVEGGRVTDQDRKIYADAFSNTVENASPTNIRLTANALVKMADKGADISKVVNELAISDLEIFRQIAVEVYKAYPDLQIKALGYDPDRYERVK